MLKPRLFRKDIAPRCAYCQLGTAKPDGSVVFCPKKGVVSPMDACRHFVYAPTKREPPRQQKLPDFSPEDFSL